MNIMRSLAVACLFAGSAFAYDVGTAYTVPAGTTVTVTDTDIDSFNTLASVSFGDAAATLVFNTSKAPTVPISGSGTIRKISADAWTLSTTQSVFAGTWDFAGGETSLKVRYALGSESSTSNIYVRSGATISLDDNEFLFANRCLHLAGTGCSNRGALRVTVQSKASNMLKYTVLDDDADLVFTGRSYLFHNAANANSEIIKLGSHTLTVRVDANSQNIYLMGGKVAGPGKIAITNISEAAGYITSGVSLRGVKIIDPTVEIVMYNCTAVSIYNHSPTNYFAKLTVEGADCRIRHTHQNNAIGVCTVGLEHDLWAGEVNLKNPESCLSAGCYERSDDTVYSQYAIGFIGPVTGPGSLMLATAPSWTDAVNGRIYLSCTSNTYTGSTKWNGSNGAKLEIPYSNNIPVYAKISANRPLEIRPNGEEHGWSGPSIARLAESMSLAGPDDPISRVFVDGSLMPGGIVTFDGAEMSHGLSSNVIAHIDGADGTTLVFTSPLGRPIQPLATSNCVVKLTGTDTLYVTNHALVYARPAPKGEIVFDGAKDVRFAGDYPYKVSSCDGARRVSFKNSRYCIYSVDEAFAYTNHSQDAICVGQHYAQYDWPGDLFFCEGSVITTRLQLAANSYSRGRVVQTGGDVTVLSTTNDDAVVRFSVGMNSGSSGYYELAGGNLTVYGSSCIGRVGGDGVVWQKGGDFKMLRHPNSPGNITVYGAWLDFGYGDNSRGHFIATGGTAYFSGVILYPRSANSMGITTVDGDADVRLSRGFACGYNNGISIVNLNGGTLSTAGDSFFTSRYTMSYYTGKGYLPEVYLNANGGRLRIRGTSNVSILGPAPSADPATSSSGAPLRRIALYEKGLTVDVTNKVAYAYRGMTNATGKGVASIPVPRKPGVIASTWVKIEGDGHGASAVAEIDRETGALTNILVTSAGFDYTWAKATFVDGCIDRTNSYTTVDCVLADNVGGGLKVEGTTGRLELHATNNYAGVTELAGGTLKLMCDCAIPAESTIVLSGGKLDMNGHTLEGGGTMPLNWAVDLDRVRAGGTVTNSWNLVFPSGATFSLLNADDLTDADRNLRTLLYVNGTLSGAPTVIGGVDDPQWKVLWSGNRLTMRKIAGSVFSVR